MQIYKDLISVHQFKIEQGHLLKATAENIVQYTSHDKKQSMIKTKPNVTVQSTIKLPKRAEIIVTSDSSVSVTKSL